MSRMIRSRKFVLASVVALPLVAGGFVLQSRVMRGGQALLDQVLQLVNERYVDTLDAGQLYEKAARGLVKELNDPYSELLAPKELKAFTTNTGGRYGGIGMQIEPQQGQIVISKVFPNTPAEAAGVREGDRIVQIDTIHVVNWTTQQAQDQLMGDAGTKVTVKFGRPGVDDADRSAFHARGHPRARGSVRDLVRHEWRQGRLHPARSLQRDSGAGGTGRCATHCRSRTCAESSSTSVAILAAFSIRVS